jgi:hypothetical protein
LAGDAELVGDLSLGAAGGKQRTGLQADAFNRLAVTQAPGRRLVSCRHAACTGQIMSPERANLFSAPAVDGDAHGCD